MAKTVATAADLLVKALTAAAESAGEVKLTGPGGLFPKPEGTQDEVLQQCVSGDAPYLEVVRTTVATRKGKETVTKYVRLTPAGVGRLIEATPPSEIADLVLRYTSRLSDADRETLYSALSSRTSGSAAELYSAAVTALDSEAERQAAERTATAKLAQVERYRQAAALKKRTAERLAADLTFCRKELAGLEALVAELAPRGEEPHPPDDLEKKPPHRLAPPEPQSREDVTFRREVAGRLVATWLESFRLNKPEGRLFLETAMGNMGGLQQVGEEGERVAFDGKYHEADVGVATGMPVRVIRPGWVLEEEDGKYRLVTAKVSP